MSFDPVSFCISLASFGVSDGEREQQRHPSAFTNGVSCLATANQGPPK
jgi:hypothetical protein